MSDPKQLKIVVINSLIVPEEVSHAAQVQTERASALHIGLLEEHPCGIAARYGSERTDRAII